MEAQRNPWVIGAAAIAVSIISALLGIFGTLLSSEIETMKRQLNKSTDDRGKYWTIADQDRHTSHLQEVHKLNEDKAILRDQLSKERARSNSDKIDRIQDNMETIQLMGCSK